MILWGCKNWSDLGVWEWNQTASKEGKISNFSFKNYETVQDFADLFYHKAQVLLGAWVLTDLDCRITMSRALQPYRELSNVMFPVLDQANNTQKITSYLGWLGAQFDAPNKGMAIHNGSENQGRNQDCDRSSKQPEGKKDTTAKPAGEVKPCNSNITIQKCNKKGHWASLCWSKGKSPGVNVVVETKEKNKGKAKLGQ